MMIDKHILCILFGFMIDKMSIFPFMFGFVVGTSVSTTATLSLTHVQNVMTLFLSKIKNSNDDVTTTVIKNE